MKTVGSFLVEQSETTPERSWGAGRFTGKSPASGDLKPSRPVGRKIIDPDGRCGHDFSRVRIHTPDSSRIEPGKAGCSRSLAAVPLLEAEAWRLAKRSNGSSELTALHRPEHAATTAEQALAGAAATVGRPLAPSLRNSLEERIGASLEVVRVDTSPQAAAIAKSLRARAWAYGPRIGFAEGAFTPASASGRELLVHEAVHVAQQQGVSPALLLNGRPRGVSFHFSVHVDREMTSDELLIAFIQQYSGLRTAEEAEAARQAANWRWTGEPMVADAAAVRRGYVLIHVRDNSLTPSSPDERRQVGAVVGQMSARERRDLNAEVDRRFWGRTQYRPGEQLGQSADDRRMAEYWLQVRDNIVRTRSAILQLPEHVRAILFDPQASRSLSPRDYETALRVGQKLAAMSAVELADWRSRITGQTDDWTTFEASLDAYLAAQEERRQEQLQLGRSAARLVGLEGLYDLRSLLFATQRLASLPSADEFGVADQDVVNARSELPGLRQDIQAALESHGFASMAEFEAAMDLWRAGFERETIRLADVMLDRLDHILYESQTRYTDRVEVASLVRSISSSGAPGHFARAREQTQRSISLSQPRSVMIETGIDDEGAIQAAVQSAEATRAGEEAMRGLSDAHPALGFPDFPRARLAQAAPEEAQSILLEYIAEHRESVRSTREEIHSDPEYIYQLDNLMAASKESQGITPNSIYDKIISGHMQEQSAARIVTAAVVAVITLALTVATMGGGAVAVAAGAAAFGLSAWQAVDAFRAYMRDSSAEDAQLLSEDPTILWLVVAVVGAAADLGAAAAAIRALRPAAIALNETGDVVAFQRAIRELPAVNARIADSAARAAEAEAAIARQWRAIAAIGHRANDVVGVVAEGGYRLMVLAWQNARRGFWRFDQYLAKIRQAGLITNAGDLAPAEIAALRGPFEEGLRRAAEGFLPASRVSGELRAALNSGAIDEAAAFGRFLGLSDDEVIEVLELQGSVARQADPDALSAGSLQAAMRERAGLAAEEGLSDARAIRGRRAVGAVEQSYEVGVAEGRRLLEGRSWRQWDGWINPFEFNGRYGQGIDDVFVDGSGRFWIVEYKGGSARLAPGQMSEAWVRRNIDRLRDAGYDFVATRLQGELDAGRLRGVVVSTPHGEPPQVILETPPY
jgi:hypothetical protein